MPTIYPILLCGGSGRRLWPISRQSYPKQFSRIIGNNSLLQQSALRFKSSKIIQFEPHLILTNLDFRFIVQEQFHNFCVAIFTGFSSSVPNNIDIFIHKIK